MASGRPRLIGLGGPTGAGKTELLLRWQREGRFDRPLAVLSADSVQVYKSLNIGSAKPTPEEQAAVPHHLINLLDLQDRFNVGDFCRAAEGLVPDLWARGWQPVLAGGTAFYFKALLWGLAQAPAATQELRARSEAWVQEQGLEALRAEVARIDPVSHERLGLNDRVRRQRVLEVWWASGRPLSSFAREGMLRQDWDLELYALDRPRPELWKRLEARLEAMLAGGWVDEVRSLLDQGASPEAPGLQTLGYSSICRWLQAGAPSQDWPGVQTDILYKTRQYAKRQRTFFRALPGFTWSETGAF